MRKSQRLEGFDYRTTTRTVLTLREWNEEFTNVVAAGGWVKRIGGDRTAFNSRGVMLFELHDAGLRFAIADGFDGSERNASIRLPISPMRHPS